MISAAGQDLCSAILSGATATTDSIIPAGEDISSSSIKSRLLRYGVSTEQFAQLSFQFTRDRLQSWGRLYVKNDAVPQIAVAYAPTPDPYIGYGQFGAKAYMLVTLGMHELLRFHSVSSVYIELANQSDAAKTLYPRELDMLRAYLNLSSVLFLSGAGTLPRFEQEIPNSICQRGYRLGEAALLFLMLHESGHAAWDRLSGEEKSMFADEMLGRGLDTSNSDHVKEYYCDIFALNSTPEGAKEAMIIASQSLLNIQNYCATYGLTPSGSHPCVADRLRAMLAFSKLDRESASSVRRAIERANSVSKIEAAGRLDLHKLTSLHDRLNNGFPWELTVARIDAHTSGTKKPEDAAYKAALDELG